MKRIIYISAIILPFVLGCSKTNSFVVPEEFSGYIFFSQDIPTKAPLIESTASMGQFGVVGYKYPKDITWTEYSQGRPDPNVFYADNGSPVPVETLTCNDDAGQTASYTPLQGWSNISHYAFFAFYPCNNSDVSFVNPDDNTISYSGTFPAIRYSMRTSDLKGSMVDVMTAPGHIGKYWFSEESNNLTDDNIKFSFEHCLSCLGLNVENASEGSIMIDNITFSLTGISYNEVIIPLEDVTDMVKRPEAAPFNASLGLSLTADEDVLETGQSIEISDKLIFIPQSDELEIKVTIGYTLNNPDYSGYSASIELPAGTQTLSTQLKKGKKHIVYLRFTDSTVNVKADVDEFGWNKEVIVDNTFN